jgi:Kef-type K+ transport system membrane component KefB/nucleotide-binding universal stress UspA family protein
MGEALLATQIALLLLVGRGLGEIMQRLGQPAVIGPLLAGLILGPSVFGWVWPAAQHVVFPHSAAQQNLIAGLADVGILMLLLLTGMETDLRLARKVGKPALAVAAAGITVPFCCGFALGEVLPGSLLPDPHQRLITAAFLGTALSISSIKIVTMVIRDMNFMRRNLGQIIVASAIMEDTVGWVIIAITLGIAGAGGLAVLPLARTVIGTAIFLVLSYTIGRMLVFKLIRYVNDYFVSEYAVITAILLVMLTMALITQAIGVNTVLGAFVAGVLVGESPILTGEIEDRLRGFITAFLTPIFFGLSGLSVDLTILKDPSALALLVVLIAIASVGKFAGAFAGGWFSGLNFREAFALGCAMNARGSTEVVVATIGLSTGALTHNLYTLIVTMAMVTTMAMPPMLRRALVRLPIDREEQQRLDHEALEARGFVSKFERLLVAADDSASGKLASQFAGFLAGQRGLPMTVLDIQPLPRSDEAAETPADAADRNLTDKSPAALAKESADKAGTEANSRDNAAKPRRAEVIARTETADATDAVAEEASKGFDVLMIGLERMCDAHGVFSEDVNRIVTSFQGPVALVIARRDGGDRAAQGERAARPQRKILVPISGTEVSRRGIELAFALTSPNAASVTALDISRRNTARDGAPQAAIRSRNEAAVLDDAKELGARHGFKVATAVHLDSAPEAAVLREGARIKADLLVIGAARRVGDALYLGETVAALMERWTGDLVILAT